MSCSGTKRKVAETNSIGENSEETCEIKNEISVVLDPDLLDCTICFNPLVPPLSQCPNGHVVCSPCNTKLNNTCPSCTLPINHRNLALEKVIESIKTPCLYVSDGCKEMVTFIKRRDHGEECVYSPCFCPVRKCTFSGHTKLLSSHFVECHKDVESEKIEYNDPTSLCVDMTTPFTVIQGDDDKLFLLLRHKGSTRSEKAVSMICIGPKSLEGKFTYELSIDNNDGNTLLMLQASMKNIKKWTPSYSADVWLPIPKFLADSSAYQTLCIRKMGRS